MPNRVKSRSVGQRLPIPLWMAYGPLGSNHLRSRWHLSVGISGAPRSSGARRRPKRPELLCMYSATWVKHSSNVWTVTDISTRARGDISARLGLKHSLSFAFRNPRRDRGAGLDESMLSRSADRRRFFGERLVWVGVPSFRDRSRAAGRLFSFEAAVVFLGAIAGKRMNRVSSGSSRRGNFSCLPPPAMV
jgi:hypothetical protein